jgi:hypothetical protein
MTQDIELHDPGILSRFGIVRTETSISLPADFSYEEFERLMGVLGLIHRVSAWYIGDSLLFGELAYKDGKYLQAAELTGLSPGALANYASVCQRVHPDRRRADLSFSHHMEIASQPPERQREWLERAAAEGWTKDALRAHVIAERDADKPPAPVCECCGQKIKSNA